MANNARSFRRYAALILIGMGALIGFLAGTLPNWNIFTQYLPTFSALWALPENRRALIALMIKVFAPVWVSILLAALCWLLVTLRPLFFEESEEGKTTSVAHVTHTAPAASPAPRPQDRPVRASPPPFSGGSVAPMNTASSQPASLPVTPPTAGPGDGDAFLQTYWTTPRLQREVGAKPGSPAPPAVSGLLGETRFMPQTPLSPPDEEVEVLDLDLEGEEEEEETNGSDEGKEPTSEHPYYIAITLLKDVTATIHVNQISRVVPLSSNARRVQLLAYLAWRRQRQYREKILEEVFAHGVSDEDASPARLTQAFNDHRKLIKGDIRRVIREINQEAGERLIPENLDIFESHQKLWSISLVICRVVDLEAIEEEHTIIEKAAQSGQLVANIPQEVKEACDRLIARYSGDFLENIIQKYEEEFDPWVSSWVREPFTLYRDYYLQALWYAAEYGLQAGQALVNERLNEESPEGAAQRRLQQEYYGKAAQLFYHYAMYATNNKFDKKLIFSRQSGRGPGERVLMAERALRRSLMLYGLTGATHLVDQAYTAFYRHMKRLSSDHWEPNPATLHDLDAAKTRTNAYRLPSPGVLGHAPLPDA